MHEGQRPFECPKCFKTFTQKGSLKYHLRTQANHDEDVNEEDPLSIDQLEQMQHTESQSTMYIKEEINEQADAFENIAVVIENIDQIEIKRELHP